MEDKLKIRPFVFINAAMSADGKISTRERRQIRISDDIDFDRTDELRASSDAVIVGIGTVLSDDPSLTVKSPKRHKERLKKEKDENPIRIVVDSKARTPVGSDMLHKGEGERIIFVSKEAQKDRVKSLKEYAEVVILGEERVDLSGMLFELGKRGVERIMVEGGATLNWALLSRKLVDELYVYIGNLIIGGSTAPTLVDGVGFTSREEMVGLELFDIERMKEGVILKWRLK
ncbi:MAG: 2,5-diamino-6-(ribosylamino)-4(3H)-pyrimidinone 5'-phosphate reductase [Halobacteriota archaeon]|nr:2,5-diamino-6-(ribosylamino)-4(3H)-pyrimidinone 5'-phosphate reductase [Halobacteriota archaeon]